MSASVEVDLGHPRRVHLVAIGGSGMSAIATVLLEQGHHVTGSDLVDSPVLDALRAAGAEVHVGHRPDLVHGAELVVASTAVADDNVELLEATRCGIDVMRRVELLRAFARRQPLVSVSGTHGKTTTTSMLAVALVGAGLDPSYLIGAPVSALGAAAAAGRGDWFVLEADESDASFLAGPRAAALVTNVEADHLEFWGGWQQLLEGFGEFLRGTDGPRLVCVDDPVAAQLGAACGAVGYGTSPDAAHRIDDVTFSRAGSSFVLHGPSSRVLVELAVPGMHNVRNAAGALALAVELGVDPEPAAAALAGFSGAARRFERRGSVGGIDFVDDYAHLPTEIEAALDAGRSGGWSRVVAVFQPHRYSRTEALWREFAGSFAAADQLVLTEIYSAGEPPRPGVSGSLLLDAVRAEPDAPPTAWAPDLEHAAELLAAELRPGDLCLTIGAGDVTQLADLVIERLET